MYLYRRENLSSWEVGYYTPDGIWKEEKVYNTAGEASDRVHWLNGGALVDVGPYRGLQGVTPLVVRCRIGEKEYAKQVLFSHHEIRVTREPQLLLKEKDLSFRLVNDAITEEFNRLISEIRRTEVSNPFP